MTTWYAAMLFAVMPLRNALPDSPPFGAWIDVTVVLWVIVALVISMALYISCWWRHLKPERQAGRLIEMLSNAPASRHLPSPRGTGVASCIGIFGFIAAVIVAYGRARSRSMHRRWGPLARSPKGYRHRDEDDGDRSMSRSCSRIKGRLVGNITVSPGPELLDPADPQSQATTSVRHHVRGDAHPPHLDEGHSCPAFSL